MSELKATKYLPFDAIKQSDEKGSEFWYARDLQMILEYTKWENFKKVVEKAMLACKHAGNSVSFHFPDIRKNVDLGLGKSKKIRDFKLTRYACYLIVQNGDPRKTVIALGQTYFAVQTRSAEELQALNKLDENNRRLVVRNQISQSNQLLAQAAHRANITTNKQFATFQNYGYRGLYGGLTVSDIHKRKMLDQREKILDYMGHAELAANHFRIAQTEEHLNNSLVSQADVANTIHHEVGKSIREFLIDMNSTLPEDLPKPDKSIHAIEREEISKIKDASFPLMLDE